MKQVTAEHINDENFERFGSVARLAGESALATTEQFQYWSDHAHYGIEGETEIGFCRIYALEGSRVDWMERHERTPEVLIPIDRPFILPVMVDGDVAAFQVNPGEAVVIGQNVWHSACLPVGGDEATYFVIFRRGTPHEDVIKSEIDAVTIAPAPLAAKPGEGGAQHGNDVWGDVRDFGGEA